MISNDFEILKLITMNIVDRYHIIYFITFLTVTITKSLFLIRYR